MEGTKGKGREGREESGGRVGEGPNFRMEDPTNIFNRLTPMVADTAKVKLTIND